MHPCELLYLHHVYAQKSEDVANCAMQAGLDSLGAVELRNTIASQLNIAIPATLAFDHPTSAAIADHISLLIGTRDFEPQAAQLPASGLLSREEVFVAVQAAVGMVLGRQLAADQPLMEAWHLASLFHITLLIRINSQYHETILKYESPPMGGRKMVG